MDFSSKDRPISPMTVHFDKNSFLQFWKYFGLKKSQGIDVNWDADNLVHSLAYFPDKLEVVDFAADFQKEICFHFSAF